MKKSILIVFTLFITNSHLWSQQVVSSTFLTSYDLSYFVNELEITFSQYGVDLYRVNYTTTNLEGALDTASGLLCIPQLEGFYLPMVSYGHGTVGSRFAVPSYLSDEHLLPAIYSSMGTVCVAPDYLGLGDNEGIHPYVHADSEASASYDLMVAAESYLADEMDIPLNDQLFITGYSQGGHSAMALHRYIEQETSTVVTGSFPMSGPYSISSGMKDLLVSEEEYGYVAYLASTAISYQEVYGTIYPNNDITQFFKQPYADIILKFQNEEADLFDVNQELIDSLIVLEGGAFPKKMIFDDIVEAILTDDNHPVNIALRDNDVYDWAPQADTRLLYCMADDQVTFENSIIARDKMIENGAPLVTAFDLNPNFNHTECVEPAATNFVIYLLLVANPTTSTLDQRQVSFTVAPNPNHGSFRISTSTIEGIFTADFYSIHGALEKRISSVRSNDVIDVDLDTGLYLVHLKDGDGNILGVQKIIIE